MAGEIDPNKNTNNKPGEMTEEDKAVAQSFLSRAIGRSEPIAAPSTADNDESDKKSDEDDESKQTTEEKKEEKKTKAEDETRQEENKKTTKKKETVTPPPPEPINYEKLTTAATKAAVQAIEQSKKKEESGKKTDTPPNPYAHLPETEQRRLRVLEHMEKTGGDRFKGLSKRYAESLSEEERYIKAWKAQNPGKEFDPESEDHQEFYNNISVTWDDDDYTEALADMKAIEKLQSVDAKLEERDRKAQEAQSEQEFHRHAYVEQKTLAKQIFSEIGEGFEKVVNNDMSLNLEEIKRLETEDPITARIVFGKVMELERVAQETLGLFTGRVKPDEKNNPLHRHIIEFAVGLERKLMAKPKEQQLDEHGRPFLPSVEYAELLNTDPKEAQKYWTFNAQDLNLLRANVTSKAIKKDLEGIEKSAAKRGFTKAKSDDTTTKKTTEKPKEIKKDRGERPEQVTTGDDTKVEKDTKAKSGGADSAASTFMQKYLGR